LVGHRWTPPSDGRSMGILPVAVKSARMFFVQIGVAAARSPKRAS